MAITLTDVDQVARLAYLRFTEQEREELLDQMNAILGYMEKLDELDTASIPPTSHVLDLKNVFREDVVEPSLSQEAALSNAPSQGKGHFTVPRVI